MAPCAVYRLGVSTPPPQLRNMKLRNNQDKRKKRRIFPSN